MASTETITRLLERKPLMLEFYSVPLARVIDEFNRHNDIQLMLGDDGLGELVMVASFRADNVKGFVQLLEATAGIRADSSNPRRIVLWRKSA